MKSQRVTEEQSGSTHSRKKKQVLLHVPLKFFVSGCLCEALSGKVLLTACGLGSGTLDGGCFLRSSAIRFDCV